MIIKKIKIFMERYLEERIELEEEGIELVFHG